jgi:hypothetical protein
VAFNWQRLCELNDDAVFKLETPSFKILYNTMAGGIAYGEAMM